MAKDKTWVLVSSGVRALIFSDLESDTAHEPIEVLSKAESTHLGEIMADRPGRSFASGDSGRRSAMEPGSDPVLHDMQLFARETLAILEDHRAAGRLNRLAVFASPRMLGVLRQEMPEALRAVVVVERDANIVNLPDAELRAVMTEALANAGAA